MAVTQTHPDYTKRLPQWTRLHDAIEGEDQVKLRGKLYLPMLTGQQRGEYLAYLQRAMFYGATDRTVDGLVGAILRKDGEQEWPDSKEDNLLAVGHEGESWAEVVHTTLAEVIGVGRYGLLVDAPKVEGGLPYVAQYTAESICDWETAVVGGRRIPVSITLKEKRLSYEQGGMVRKEEIGYRVLRLGPPGLIPRPGAAAEIHEGGDGATAIVQRTKFHAFLIEYLRLGDDDLTAEGMVYWQEIWVKAKDPRRGNEWELADVVVPRMTAGKAVGSIPFVFFNPSSTKAQPEKPPLLDMVNVNFSHFCNSADLEHGLHFTALPTPWAAGFDIPELTIGSERAWVTEDSGARAGFLEFTGAGLGTLSAQMDKKEQLMAVLGARLLEEQPKHVEAAATVRLRHQGEDSALSRISKAVSDGLTTVLRTLAEWLGVTTVEDILIRLNRDFDTKGIEPKFLAQLMLAVQSGMVSWSTFFHQLKVHEVIPEGVTEEDEQGRILEGSPGAALAADERDEEAARSKEMLDHEAALNQDDDDDLDDKDEPPGKGKQKPSGGGKQKPPKGGK